MFLTEEQKRMRDGDDGEVVEKMVRLLVRLGEIYGADRMIPVGSVQVGGREEGIHLRRTRRRQDGRFCLSGPRWIARRGAAPWTSG